MPSIPTFSSTYSMPASAHVVASSSLIVREASLISVSPLQNSAKPSPVPGPSTKPVTPGWRAVNASKTRLLIGRTVDDPEIWMSPARVSSLAAEVAAAWLSDGDELAED